MPYRKTRSLWSLIVVFTLVAAGCGESKPPEQPAATAPAKPPEPAVPPEIQAVAEASLGSEVTVLRHGDLAKAGSTHVFAANLLKTTPTGVAPGTLFSRAVILAQEDGKWREVFRCDEHLKNAKGFLAGTPLSSITGWRVQHEMSDERGLTMYFSPIVQPKTGAVRPIGVRWNSKVKRYQSLDRNYENFLGEVSALQNPESYLR
jgi:hypothetical protein